MKRTNRELNELFDDATAAVRAEKLDDGVVEVAAKRVQALVAGDQAAAQVGVAPTVEHIRNCGDFQSLIPAYLHGYLSSARVLLLEDHTGECVPCRKALKEARAGHKAASVEAARPEVKPKFGFQMPALRFAMAAALLVGFGLFAWPFAARFMNSVGTLHAIVEAANGNVLRVAESQTQALKPGAELPKGERIRTAKNAGAVVKLNDGTLIEMRERSELSLSDNVAGTTINLERGQVIVQAAKQRDRKLFVATDEALVAVTGTIFSVNSGTKGARVSVIEGEVHVDQSGKDHALHAGDQMTTHVSINRTLIKDEIAWSRDSARYVQMLDAIRQNIDEQLAMPGNRYSTRLLDLMPEDTTIYAAIPNLSGTLAEAYRLLQENIEKSPELKAWWEEQQAQKGDEELRKLIDQVAEYGQFLGPEIAVGAAHEMIALAELRDAAGFRAKLEQQLGGTMAEKKDEWRIRLIDDPANIPAARKVKKDDEGTDELLIWAQGDVLAATTEPAYLRQLAATLQAGGANRFAAQPFRARLADVYREGAGLIVGVDLERLLGKAKAEMSAEKNGREAAMLEQLGVSNLRHFILEIKDKDGKHFNRAIVSYDEAQRGLTSWLNQPGPMGALEFFSPDANIAAAVVVREPLAVVDDLLNTLRTAEPEAYQKLLDFQREHGIDLRNDIAAPLGSEYAFGVDGPLLPTPSWKAVFEVDDPTRLQQTIERTVEKFNQELAREGKPGLRWENVQSGSRTYYTLRPPDAAVPLSVSYAYAYGFLVAAPSRALVESAIRYKESGRTLLLSPKFKATLPEDKQANFSAMFYQNLGSTVGALAKKVGQATSEGRTKKNDQQMLSALIGDKAGLVYAYALGDRMIFSVNTEDGPVGLSVSDFLGMPGSAFGNVLRAVKH